MDGAGKWQTFRYVTLPLMKPVLAVSILLRAMETFKEFDKPYILTGGGPGNATEVIDIYTYLSLIHISYEMILEEKCNCFNQLFYLATEMKVSDTCLAYLIDRMMNERRKLKYSYVYSMDVDPYYSVDATSDSYDSHKAVSYTHLDVYKRQVQKEAEELKECSEGIQWIEGMHCESVHIKSEDGLRLKGYYLEAEQRCV